MGHPLVYGQPLTFYRKYSYQLPTVNSFWLYVITNYNSQYLKVAFFEKVRIVFKSSNRWTLSNPYRRITRIPLSFLLDLKLYLLLWIRRILPVRILSVLHFISFTIHAICGNIPKWCIDISFQLTVFTHPPCFSSFCTNRMPLIIDGCFMHCICVHCLWYLRSHWSLEISRNMELFSLLAVVLGDGEFVNNICSPSETSEAFLVFVACVLPSLSSPRCDATPEGGASTDASIIFALLFQSIDRSMNR